MKQSTSDPKLSAYDKQLLEDMRGSTPSGRLTTIDEGIWIYLFLKKKISNWNLLKLKKERSKLKNKLKENRFIKSNKLAPYDDRSDPEIRTKSGTSWAIAGNSYADSKKPLSNFDRPNRRFEIWNDFNTFIVLFTKSLRKKFTNQIKLFSYLNNFIIY